MNQENFVDHNEINEIKVMIVQLKESIYQNYNETLFNLTESQQQFHQYVHEIQSSLASYNQDYQRDNHQLINTTSSLSQELQKIQYDIKTLTEANDFHIKRNQQHEEQYTMIRDDMIKQYQLIEEAIHQLYHHSNETDDRIHHMETILAKENLEQIRVDHLDHLNDQKESLHLLALQQQLHTELIEKHRNNFESNEFIQMKNQINELMKAVSQQKQLKS
jgi:hypothetical protein